MEDTHVCTDLSGGSLPPQPIRLLLDKNIPGWVGLWAKNGVMQFPFCP